MQTYLDLLKVGKVGFEDFDDWVRAWHFDQNFDGTFDEYIGFTPEEAEAWAKGKPIESIVKDRYAS